MAIVTINKSTWTTVYVNDLPDSSFAYIESGGEKKDGKTEPRSLRHLPYKDANGNVDAAHCRNALARLSQVKGLSEEKETAIREKLQQALESLKSKKSLGTRIMKANDELQIVYGCVSDPYLNGDEGAQEDSQNDWTPPAEVQAMAHRFLKSKRVVKLDHNGDPVDAAVIESWLESYESAEQYQKAMENKNHRVLVRKFGDDVIHSGAWMVGVQLSDALWQKYKDGEINAFSPGGWGHRQAVAKELLPKVEFVS